MKMNFRKFSRVNTYMPFEVRLLSPEEHTLKSRISQDEIVIDSLCLPELENKDLQKWLSAINCKLDMLLMSHQDYFCDMDCRPINISAGGMKFSSKQKFELGDMVEIQLVLQVDPCKILYLIAAVIRVDQVFFKFGTYSVAVKFLDITEDIQNELLKYDFKRQYELVLKEKDV